MLFLSTILYVLSKWVWYLNYLKKYQPFIISLISCRHLKLKRKQKSLGNNISLHSPRGGVKSPVLRRLHGRIPIKWFGKKLHYGCEFSSAHILIQMYNKHKHNKMIFFLAQSVLSFCYNSNVASGNHNAF